MTNIIKTSDGSYTLFNNNFKEHYHSVSGALTESKHIFVNYGLFNVTKDKIKITEFGYGTGLNAALTLIYGNKKKITYTGYELFPPKDEMLKKFYDNFDERIKKAAELLREAPWDNKTFINKNFTLFKIKTDFTNTDHLTGIDMVYFDAFSPDSHPEAWDFKVLKKIYNSLNPGGILLTYSSKGSVKKALRDCGFHIERLKGPPGKRHVIRAKKI